jgi:hypothetical protein
LINRLVGWFTIFLAVYTFFAPAGLPSCWLEKKACEIHPHPGGHAELPHSHEYLFEDMQADGVAIPEQAIPTGLLLRFLQQVSISWRLYQPEYSSMVWSALFEPPPPKI